MTTVKFFYDGGIISGFELTGHATADENDADGKLLCSAVSSAAYMTANTLIEIVKAKADISIGDAKMYLHLKNRITESQPILEGFKLHLNALSKGNENRLTLLSEV